MIRNDIRELAEPEVRYFVEYTSFIRNGFIQYYIEGRQPIRGHNEQPIVAHRVVIADFAASDQWSRMKRGTIKRRGMSQAGKCKNLIIEGANVTTATISEPSFRMMSLRRIFISLRKSLISQRKFVSSFSRSLRIADLYSRRSAFVAKFRGYIRFLNCFSQSLC